MIRAILIGALGKMGRAVLQSAFRSKDIEIVAVVENHENQFVNKQITKAVPDSELNIAVSSNMFQSMARGDVVIDFSVPAATMEALKIAKRKELPLIVGTTGFNKTQFSEMKKISRDIPVVLSSNMSAGINVLAGYASKLANTLGEEYDIEILDTHHRGKTDAPSGTALYLASSIASGLKKSLGEILIDGKRSGEREIGKIGLSSMRGGDVVGDHTVYFFGNGERIELTHRVLDRKVFAEGALRAARWVIGKEPGLYSMLDVLDVK